MDIDVSLLYEYFWIFLIAITTLLIIYSIKISKKVKKVLENQALKRGGNVSGFFSNLKLTFDHDGKKVIVSTFPGSRYTSPYTSVDIDIDNLGNRRLIIYEESLMFSIGKSFDIKEFQVGYDLFDDRFVIKGNDEQFVLNMLTPSIQDRLLSLRPYHIRLTLDHNHLNLNIPRQLKKEEDCDLLIDTALLIVDRLDEIQ